MSRRTYQKKLDKQRRGIISGESRNSRSGFWKKLFPKKLENSQKNACDRVLIVTSHSNADTHSTISLQKDLQQKWFSEWLFCRIPEVHLEPCKNSLMKLFFAEISQQNSSLVLLDWLMCFYKGVLLSFTRNLSVLLVLEHLEKSRWNLL